jgi:hypothetical protein
LFFQVKNALDLFFEERVQEYISRIQALGESDIEAAYAELPLEWNFTQQEQGAVTAYLLHRRAAIKPQFFSLVSQAENL